MPLSKYNKEFGGKAGSAAKAHAAMVKEYGAKKGEQVFYATKNARKSGGDFQPQGNDTDAYDSLSSEVEDDNDTVPERPPHGTSTASRSGWKRGDNQI